MTAFKDDAKGGPGRGRFADVLGERRGAPPKRPGFCSQPAEHSALERLREFTRDDGVSGPHQLAAAHGFSLVEGKMARSRGDAPVYFLHDTDPDGEASVRALVVPYPGRRPGVRRGVLFVFDSEAS
jgi:hypothetical protein